VAHHPIQHRVGTFNESVSRWRESEHNPEGGAVQLRALGFLMIAVLGTASCANSSGVFQRGPDDYTISASARPVGGGAVSAQSMAIMKAKEFCAQSGKEMVVRTIETNDLQVQVDFRCVGKNEPTIQQY